MLRVAMSSRVGWLLVTAGLVAFGLAAVPELPAAQPSRDADWPCQQRLVPELAAAAVWQGPELPAADDNRSGDPQVAELVRKLLAGETDPHAASAAIDAYIGSGSPDARRQRTAQLFTGVLDSANAERGRMIEGIERFARRQRELAEKINTETRQLRDLEAQGTRPALAEAADIKEARAWDMRIYDDRAHTMGTVCQQPVMLDQRVFALARVMAAGLQ